MSLNAFGYGFGYPNAMGRYIVAESEFTSRGNGSGEPLECLETPGEEPRQARRTNAGRGGG